MNEARTIERCLDSIRPHIDEGLHPRHWLAGEPGATLIVERAEWRGDLRLGRQRVVRDGVQRLLHMLAPPVILYST